MRKQRNIHRSAEDWQSILNAFNESSLTQEEFCKSNRLAPSTFAKWKKQLGGSNSTMVSDFIDVSPKSVTSSSPPTASRFELSISFASRFELHVKMA